MQDHSCHVPSAACQMPKSTGCCLGEVYCPRSGSPAICQNSPSTLGTMTCAAANVLPRLLQNERRIPRMRKINLRMSAPLSWDVLTPLRPNLDIEMKELSRSEERRVGKACRS